MVMWAFGQKKELFPHTWGVSWWVHCLFPQDVGLFPKNIWLFSRNAGCFSQSTLQGALPKRRHDHLYVWLELFLLPKRPHDHLYVCLELFLLPKRPHDHLYVCLELFLLPKRRMTDFAKISFIFRNCVKGALDSVKEPFPVHVRDARSWNPSLHI